MRATHSYGTLFAAALGGFVTIHAVAQSRAPSAAPPSQRSIPAETTAAANLDKGWRAPRTSWGHPSFEGVWSTDDLRGVPMNRPAEQAGRESLTPEEFAKRAASDEGVRNFDVNVGTFLQHESGIRSFGYTSLVVDPPSGQMPALTAAGKVLAGRRTRGTYGPGPFDDLDDFSLYDRCITRGVLGSLLPVIYGNGLRITQNPNTVAISYEMIHDTRIIPLDGRPRLESGIRQYLGSARGHFEGDTLVVETTNFTDRTSIGVNGGGPPNSERLKLTERFTRVDPEMIEYRATVDDPGAYTAPFTIRLMITSRPGYEVLEYSCHEGNFFVANGLRAEKVYQERAREAIAAGEPIPARSVDSRGRSIFAPPDASEAVDINAGR
jgi:hypothetical protein